MFDPQRVEVFRFTSCCFDEETGVALFEYAFDDDLHFTESYTFPVSGQPLPTDVRAAVDRGLFLLSLMAGISYYKAAVPPTVSIETGAVTAEELAILQKFYFEGLGEFSYVNQVSLQGRPQWNHQLTVQSAPPALHLPRRSLVAVGGGKDSCVSIEILRANDEPMILASVNQAKAIVECVKDSGLPSVTTSRTLSPVLMKINDSGALNGHVPITAMVSLTLAVTALIAGCDSVVMSNERSASSGNLQWDGREVNHQYSKSFEAEQMITQLIHRSIAPDLNYFSLLRPLSELDIARRFSETNRYDSSFTSCNRAFRIDRKRRYDHWCADCDKCRFVYLALAPNMSRKRLHKIFGADMLDDPRQIPGFEALCGWNADKPFECVGEIEESIAAFLQLAEQSDWKDQRVVTHFATQVLPNMVLPSDISTRPFVPSSQHQLSERFALMLGVE